MASFIREANPIWFMVDLVGLPLNDEYYAFFLSNTFPYVPQAVYHDNLGTTPWSSGIVQFQASGTLPNELYFDESLVYRIEIRHGNTQADPLIWLIEDFTPGSGDANTSNDFKDADNQISNPQFEYMNVISPFVYTNAVPGTYNIDIAPDWTLNLVGAGTITLTQSAIIGTTAPANGNPSYMLNVDSIDWTTVKLIQKFDKNGSIFSSGSVSASVTARAYVSSLPIEITYEPSFTTDIPAATSIAIGTIPSGSFLTIRGASDITASSNNTSGENAYVNIVITLPPVGEIDITNIQIMGQTLPLPSAFVSTDAPEYIQETSERQTDYLFHYYKPQLAYQPIPSFLVGWDFPLNPAQILGESVIAAALGAVNRSRYIWDQTIVFQAVDNTLSYSRDSTTSGFKITDAGTGSRLAVIQYLAGKQLFNILTQKLALQLKGKISTGTIAGTITLAWTAAASPFVPALPLSCITSVAASGIPVLEGTFTAVPNVNYSVNVPFTLTTTNTIFDFSGFDSTAVNTTTATAFAIIISFDTLAIGSSITIDYCSLVGGDIATRPAPQTVDQVLRECQYYYEKSYETNVLPTTATDVNASSAVTNGAGATIEMAAMDRPYKTTKRIAPTMAAGSLHFYNPVSGVIDSIRNYTAPSNHVIASGTFAGKNSTGYPQTSVAVVAGQLMGVQWVADVRLGII